MTAPSRQPWAVALARAYARRRLARDLDGLFAAGLDPVQTLCRRSPVLFAATHVAWWDPLVLLALDGALRTRGHALMDAHNLDRLPFFGAIGALPLGRGRPGAVRGDLRRAAGALEGPGDALWIFPQGRQRPASARPLGLEPGVRLLARLGGAPVVPVALRYGFREAERPAAVVDLGAPLDPRDPALLDRLEEALVAGLARGEALLDAPGLAGDRVPAGSPFRALVPPARRPGDEGLATRALAGLTRLLSGGSPALPAPRREGP